MFDTVDLESWPWSLALISGFGLSSSGLRLAWLSLITTATITGLLWQRGRTIVEDSRGARVPEQSRAPEGNA